RWALRLELQSIKSALQRIEDCPPDERCGGRGEHSVNERPSLRERQAQNEHEESPETCPDSRRCKAGDRDPEGPRPRKCPQRPFGENKPKSQTHQQQGQRKSKLHHKRGNGEPEERTKPPIRGGKNDHIRKRRRYKDSLHHRIPIVRLDRPLSGRQLLL